VTTSDGYVLKMERMPRRSAPTSVPSLHWHRHPCHWYRSLHPAGRRPQTQTGRLAAAGFPGCCISLVDAPRASALTPDHITSLSALDWRAQTRATACSSCTACWTRQWAGFPMASPARRPLPRTTRALTCGSATRAQTRRAITLVRSRTATQTLAWQPATHLVSLPL